MKKNIYLLTLLFAASMFMACGGDDPLPRVVYVTGVSVSPTTVQLFVSDAKQLEVTVAPADADNTNVTWSSSAPTIATVSATGLVTANATTEGTATITVTTVCGGFTATTEVTVEIPAVLVTGVELDATDFDLLLGEYKELTATVTPVDADNTNVTWESGDDTIATVSNDGVVTAVGVGTTTITVTTVCGGHTAEVEVTVFIIPVTGITLDCETTVLNLELGDHHSFSVTITPYDASNRDFTWVSCTPSVASVTAAGLVNAIGTGTATLTVTTDCGDFYQEVAVTVVAVGQTEEGVVIDGVRWATRNVDAPGYFATAAHSQGRFFQWNRRTAWHPDPAYTGTNPPAIAHDGSVWSGDSNIGSETGYWYAENDPCPPGWRIPTRDEFLSLEAAGYYQETNWNGTGVRGIVFGTAPYQVFFPRHGMFHWTGLFIPDGGGSSIYWSSQEHSPTNAYRLGINPPPHDLVATFRTFKAEGANIRCVAID